MRAFTFFASCAKYCIRNPQTLIGYNVKDLLQWNWLKFLPYAPTCLGLKMPSAQQLYQHAASIEAVYTIQFQPRHQKLADAFEFIDDQPLAAASVGQVHGRLKTGEEVVIKFIKQANAVEFKKKSNECEMVANFLNFRPKLRSRYGPVNHVADYIAGTGFAKRNQRADELKGIQSSLTQSFGMSLLVRF